MNYNSFFVIGGIIFGGEFDLEPQSFSSLQLDDLAAERLERGRKSAKAESVRRTSRSNETGESRPGLFEHYLRTLWFGATEPFRRVFEKPSILVPTGKTPRALVGVMLDITLDQLENQYEYFIAEENPWD